MAGTGVWGVMWTIVRGTLTIMMTRTGNHSLILLFSGERRRIAIERTYPLTYDHKWTNRHFSFMWWLYFVACRLFTCRYGPLCLGFTSIFVTFAQILSRPRDNLMLITTVCQGILRATIYWLLNIGWKKFSNDPDSCFTADAYIVFLDRSYYKLQYDWRQRLRRSRPDIHIKLSNPLSWVSTYCFSINEEDSKNSL